MKSRSIVKTLIAAVSTAAITATPVHADDSSSSSSSTATGIAAAFGLATADGKSSINDGAGAIEAALLESEAMARAGDAIRKLASEAAPGRPVFVLAKADPIDLSTAWWVPQRAQMLIEGLKYHPPSGCTPPPAPAPRKEGPNLIADVTPNANPLKPSFADIGAALTTTVSLGKITLNTDDRILINAILTGHIDSYPTWSELRNALPEYKTGAVASNVTDKGGKVTRFVLLNEAQTINYQTNPLLINLRTLEAAADARRSPTCDNDPNKVMVAAIDKFIADITDASKGVPSIILAARLADQQQANPLILRVSVDERGGTSIARSNIWYSIGIPGATVITSGLKVSFQINDPGTGENLMTGEIRCAIRPTSFNDVRHMLVTHKVNEPFYKKQLELTSCGYRTS